MGQFFLKTVKLWGALICFAISVGLFYLMGEFFTNGGGFIRVKGLLAPIVFAIFGLILLLGFIKSSFKEGNRGSALITIVLLCGIGGVIYYFSSDNLKHDRTYEKIVSNDLTEEEAFSEIIKMLNESDVHSITTAIKCLEHYASNNSAQANFKLGEIYFTDEYGLQDYSKAYSYLDKARELFEIEDASNGDSITEHDLSIAYDYLGDIYSKGLNGETNIEKAINYYKLALEYPINLHSKEIESKIQELTVSNVSADSVS